MNGDLSIVIALQSMILAIPGGAVMAVFCAQWLIYFFIGITVYLSLEKSQQQKRLYIEAFIATAGAFGISYIMSHWFMRTRPYLALPNTIIPLIDPPLTAYSFPSSHATVAFALAASLSYMNPRSRYAVFLMAFLIAVGRVFVGVHYLSDVIIGAAIGLLTAYVFHAMIPYMRKKTKTSN